MAAKPQALPHWDLSNVYPGLDAEAFERDLQEARKDLVTLEGFCQRRCVGRLEAMPQDLSAVAADIDDLLEQINELGRRIETLGAFAYAFVTTDSYNQLAARRVSELEQLEVQFKKIHVRLQSWLGSLQAALPKLYEIAPVARAHSKVLDHLAEQSRYLMVPEMEDLAAELHLSGGGAVWKLQGNVTSQLKMPIEREGKVTELPMTMIRNLANDPDEALRRQAYEAELKGWGSIRESVAFALNSVQGSAITLAKWRGREGVLHAALDQNRIDRETLEPLLAAMRAAFPTFRRYFRSKARKLGKEQLPWWDLFAPVGKVSPSYDWKAAEAMVVEQFGRFDDELAEFAGEAFARRWIDAEPRDGKRGGAFCMGIPAVEESRILANFDGSFDATITLAHELGHGFHNHCQKGLPMLRRGAPMTLAETASIFCETLVLEAALRGAAPEAQLFILENQLMGASQVIVDIYSRYVFETETLKRRAQAELSPDEMCEIMLAAQTETYGDGIDPEYRHPYMWLLKPHYYAAERHFYNYPYAFGQLFGLGMYAVYEREGKAFIPRYKELLRSTGEEDVAPLAARFGIDVRTQAFWDQSLAVLAKRIDRYCELDA